MTLISELKSFFFLFCVKTNFLFNFAITQFTGFLSCIIFLLLFDGLYGISHFLRSSFFSDIVLKTVTRGPEKIQLEKHHLFSHLSIF